jgi:site-specific DNA recombinase
MRNAVIYARFSSSNQREESIDAQVRACSEYAQKHNLNIVKKFIDRATTGTNVNREGFLEMIDYCKKTNDVEAVIVHKMDRFSRDRYQSLLYKGELKKHGVQFISVLENLDNSPESIILESVLDGFNEYYSRNLARETMKGLKENARKAKYTGGTLPLGYDADEDKNYVINEEEAKIVKKIFYDYLDGSSIKKIAEDLNLKNYKTKLGNKFSIYSVSNILKNEKYKGVYTFNKIKKVKYPGGSKKVKNDKDEIIRIENAIPKIVPESVFDNIEKKSKKNQTIPGSYNAHEPYLLTGIIFCGKCGERMNGTRKKGGSKRTKYYSYYQCSGRRRFRTCDMPSVNKEDLEEAIISYMENTLFTDEYIDEIIDNLYESYVKFSKQNETDKKVLSERIDSLTDKYNELVERLIDTDKDKTTGLLKAMNKIDEKRAGYEELLENANKYSKRVLTKKSLKKYLMSGKDIRNKSLKEQKKIIHKFVEKVTVYEDRVDVKFFVDYFGDKKTRAKALVQT